ncbi:hypothetical protein FJT64_022115 [Amphibalanus amphitrite]|uniref:Uncharacterized protein n=1 Tax=Amphibalanus amphitrite TaxID=1232801 RepID=A0A6A4WM43_AMPAM|nr:hypothetical protein FJT64_022115 [Amphibalanus amphitrite]
MRVCGPPAPRAQSLRLGRHQEKVRYTFSVVLELSEHGSGHTASVDLLRVPIRVLFCVAGALAAPQFLPDQQQDFVQSGFGQGGGIQPNYGSSGAQTRILSQKFVQDIVGNYEYSYDQDNGQTVVEVGRSQPGPAPETGTLSKRGSYSFIGDDGNTYRVDTRPTREASSRRPPTYQWRRPRFPSTPS